MALQSPGVQVTVIDESFYAPAAPGTTPLIVIATAKNKTNAAGTNIASGTLTANAGKVFNITSQRDLVDVYGAPYFETAEATPIHGSERNEYGLLAAYSVLGVSNSAFVVRADIDLNQLAGKASVPDSNADDGAWWVDTHSSIWGIHEWNGDPLTARGQVFSHKVPLVLTDADTNQVDENGKPTAVGTIGDYAVVFRTTRGSGVYHADREEITIWHKAAGNGTVGVNSWPGGGTGVDKGQWTLVGSNEWAASIPTVVGSKVSLVTSLTATKSFTINGTTVTVGAIGSPLSSLVTTINNLAINGVTARDIDGVLHLYTNGINQGVGDSSLSNAIVIAVADATGTPIVAGDLAELGITVGTVYGPALQQSPHVTVPEWKIGDVPSASDRLAGRRASGSLWLKTTQINVGARLRIKRWDTASSSWIVYEAPMFDSSCTALYKLAQANNGVIPTTSLYVQTNSQENSGWDDTPETTTFRIWTRSNIGATTATSKVITPTTINSTPGTVIFSISASTTVSTGIAMSTPVVISVSTLGDADDAAKIVNAINSSNIPNIEVKLTNTNELTFSHKTGGDIRITDTTGTFAKLFSPINLETGIGSTNVYDLPVNAIGDYVITSWSPLSLSNFAAAETAPAKGPENGQLWYDTRKEVDIMIHNGKTWVGYRSEYAPYGVSPLDTSAPNRVGYAPLVSASNPWSTSTLTGDIWVSTADLENYPTVYRYNANVIGSSPKDKWELVDVTDQQTDAGMLFADARYGIAGNTGDIAAPIADLLVNNYLDPDAPDPALYPKGMLLWNLRRSGNNVKRYVKGHITLADNPRFDNVRSPLGQAFIAGQLMADYAVDRWVTASVNHENGAGTFGRAAQRAVVVAAIKATILTSSELRDEERRNFNLITCPGYPEVIGDMVGLNIDRGLTAFVLGDTPLRLPADATSITSWATNERGVVSNSEQGIVTYDEYLGVFYPSGMTTDLSGNRVVVPSSHMMLKTIILSDNVSYPWFAPAGTRRGGISNAESVGYIDADSGEYQVVALNEGQRDTLYDAKINPITFFSGVGHVNFGQKTRARNASALDRINVARLVIYLRIQLNRLSRPYIFEPNDQITRKEIQHTIESLLLELVSLRAISDYAVVCDDSNNTPTRVDRNELWVDIAIIPTKAVEFIYIPLRVKNTGAI